MSENNFESLGLTLLVDVQLPNLQSQDDLKELYLLAQSGEGCCIFSFMQKGLS